MKFIGKWLLKKVRLAERENEVGMAKTSNCIDTPREVSDFGRPLNITVYNAVGGKIVTFRHYDKNTERQNESTYIVHPDEEFSESLGKLIAMEEIKRGG